LKKTLFLILIISSICYLYGYELDTPPFVSGIRSTVTEGRVVLIWRNPSGITHDLLVIRSDKVIETDAIARTGVIVARLTNKEERYIDTPTAGKWFYAVVLTTNGEIGNNRLFAHRNYTAAPVEILELPLPILKTISATHVNNSIQIEWTYDINTFAESTIEIFRHTIPINSQSILESSVKIGRIPTTNKLFIDVAIANIDYYYAAFIDGRPITEFIPAVNYTDRPVKMTQRSEMINGFNNDTFIPLPLIAIDQNILTGERFRDPAILRTPVSKPLSDNVRAAINLHRQRYAGIYNNYMKSIFTESRIQFELLPDENAFLSGGSPDAAYVEIINDLRSPQRLTAIEKIELYIAEPLPRDTLIRASFYLGALYYETGNYYKSYINLVIAAEDFAGILQPYFTQIYNYIYNEVK